MTHLVSFSIGANNAECCLRIVLGEIKSGVNRGDFCSSG